MVCWNFFVEPEIMEDCVILTKIGDSSNLDASHLMFLFYGPDKSVNHSVLDWYKIVVAVSSLRVFVVLRPPGCASVNSGRCFPTLVGFWFLPFQTHYDPSPEIASVVYASQSIYPLLIRSLLADFLL